MFKVFRTTLLYCLIILPFLTGCKKNADNTFSISSPPDLTTKVKSSVSGFVTDENNLAVNFATVQVSTSTITTDKYGYFEFKNVDVVKNAAVVTVTQPGYFKGIKTYIASENKSAFFRIKLIPKTIAGTINATAGGVVSLANGLSISLPANAIVNAASNTAYSGTVNIFAHWINPTGSDLPNSMPGDLRGLNTAGNMQLLTTYGMAAVELTGSSGELLQMATGKKSTLSFPIPASIGASAPATIPLWYFDEAKGLWQEEGSAVKSGNNYIGEVGHFSFWNCDYPNNYVQFSCSVVNASMQPIQNAYIKITNVNNPANFAFGHTDATGFVIGAVPDNAQLLLEIFNNPYCLTTIHSQTFNTTNSNVSLGNIVIAAGLQTASISGTVTDCNNNPVSNGYVIMIANNYNYRFPLSSTGTYNFSVLLCGSNTNAIFIAEDISSLQQNAPFSQVISAGSNAVPNLQACGFSAQEFLHYSIDGVNYSFTAPIDSVAFYGSVNSPEPEFWAARLGTNQFAKFRFFNSGIFVNSTHLLNGFTSSNLVASSQPANPIIVRITEYGPIGQFIGGNFTGTLVEQQSPNAVHTVTCYFRARRNL
ncbi:MAG: hypothetical protein WBP16_03585 [Ferruginibacter sp.]